MFDIGWTELAIITVVAIIVIGPRDLPKVLRTLGQWIGKAKKLAREFQDSLDEVIRETELDEVKKQIDQAGRLDVRERIGEAVDPDKELEKSLDFSEMAKDPFAEAEAEAPGSEAAAQAPDSETTPATGAKRAAGTKSGGGAKARTAATSGAKTGTKAKPAAKSGAKAKTGTKTGTKAKPAAKTGAKAKTGTKARPGAKSGSKAGSRAAGGGSTGRGATRTGGGGRRSTPEDEGGTAT